jgi:hypothetical protein
MSGPGLEGACGPGLGEDVPGCHPLPRRRLQRLRFPLVVHRAEMLNAREPGREARTTWTAVASHAVFTVRTHATGNSPALPMLKFAYES